MRMRTSPFFARLHPCILARSTRGRNQTGPEQPFGTDSAPRCLIHRELAKISSPSKVLTKFLIFSIFTRLQRRPVTPGMHNVYVPGEHWQVDHQWCCNFCKRSSDVRKEMMKKGDTWIIRGIYLLWSLDPLSLLYMYVLTFCFLRLSRDVDLK